MEIYDKQLDEMMTRLKGLEPVYTYLLEGRDNTLVADAYLKIHHRLLELMEQQKDTITLPDWYLNEEEFLEKLADLYQQTYEWARERKYERAAALRDERQLFCQSSTVPGKLFQQLCIIKEITDPAAWYHHVLHFIETHKTYYSIAVDPDFIKKVGLTCTNMLLIKIFLLKGFIHKSEYDHMTDKCIKEQHTYLHTLRLL